jgi:hypothetical protein
MDPDLDLSRQDWIWGLGPYSVDIDPFKNLTDPKYWLKLHNEKSTGGGSDVIWGKNIKREGEKVENVKKREVRPKVMWKLKLNGYYQIQ